tara:strand:+ start:178 stop:507 length:330 start_codon:yes stop_codon:yes gene_type:complete
MSNRITTQTYSQFNTDITELLKTGQYSKIITTIYTDEACTTVALLDGTPIENVHVKKIATTASYLDKDSNTVAPRVHVTFGENKCLCVVDNVDSYWYKLSGETFKPKFA